MPETMKAAILVELNKPLVLAEVDLPRELRYGQVLVKVLHSGICGSQLGEIAGVKGPDAWLPHLLGHEGSGLVMAVGEGVSTVREGDLVVMHWLEGAGLCGPPPKYGWDGRTVNAGFVTTFNEFAVASENRVTAIPPEFPARLAPLFGCAVPTGLGVMDNKAKLRIGESVVVFGAGGVGLNVIQGASLKSGHPIVAVDLVDSRLELARRFGATHVVNSAKEDVEARIREIVGASGADVVVDNTGNTKVIEMAYRLTAAQGKALLVGVPRKGDEAQLYTLPLHFGKQITGTKGGEGKPQTDIPRYVRLHDAGKLDLAPLITEEFSLDQINTALERMRGGKTAGRVLITMDHT
jgi:S-(hydroxymethyl)glutathione dehydrogenase/alcohol dehydrogenase